MDRDGFQRTVDDTGPDARRAPPSSAWESHARPRPALVHASKLYLMGFASLRRSRMPHDRALGVHHGRWTKSGVALINTSSSTTIALRCSVGALPRCTRLDLRGNIPSFIHISDGKLRPLLPEAGAIYVVDRGYVDFARLYPKPFDARLIGLFGADGSLDRHHLPRHLPGRLLHPSGLPRTSAALRLFGPGG